MLHGDALTQHQNKFLSYLHVTAMQRLFPIIEIRIKCRYMSTVTPIQQVHVHVSAQNNGQTSVNFRSICAYDRTTCTRAGHLVRPFLWGGGGGGGGGEEGCTIVLISYGSDCDMHDSR